MRFAITALCLMLLSVDSFAAKKDFRGLFGSYRKEKYVENEANSSDFGFDLSLSTLFPVTSVVDSTESGSTRPLYYANFFDMEANFFFTVNYNFQFGLGTGYFGYDTRKQNASDDVAFQQDQPLFHEFEMSVIPVIASMRYRFGTNDIVPYVGFGIGYGRITRRFSYDYDPTNAIQMITSDDSFLGQLILGAEFYMTSNVGLRLEASGMWIGVSQKTKDAGVASYPTMIGRANIWSVRYSSGIFFLF